MTQHPTSTTPDATPPHDPPRRRRPRRSLVATLAVVGTVLLVVGLALFQPWRLLTRSTIDEPLPAAAATWIEPMPAESASGTSEPTPPATRSATGATAQVSPRVLSEGRFVDAEHATSGTARVLELAGGSRYLRLEGFSTSDGPDLHVWITDQPAGSDWGRYDDGVHVPLGALKATDGNQNYAIPQGVDLSRVTSAVIWCDRFNVAFGTAPIRIA